MGSVLSTVAIWIFEPQVGGVNGDGACCFLVGVGCWNCSGARLTQFFMLVLSVLSVQFQSKSMPQHLDPVQSVLMG